jgi:type II secretory pathway component PulF
MTETTDDRGAMTRVRTFWRRALLGPSPGARIEIYEELAPTLGAGIGLREALRSTAERHGGTKRRTVELLAAGLERDVAPSETMRANPDSFTPIEAALLSTGERTGRLDIAFRGAAAQLERSRGVRNRLLQAVAYPLLLVHCFILMCSVVRMFGGGSFILTLLPMLIGFWGTIVVIASLHAANADRPGYARFLHRIPIVGRVVRAGALARFARSFAALHGGGVPYDESLRVAADASGNAVLRADAAVAIHALSRGAPLPAALDQMTTIPSDDRGILIAGEQSGELEAAGLRVANLEDERFDVVVKRMASVLPGILVAIMGIVIGAYAFHFYAGQYAELDKMLK